MGELKQIKADITILGSEDGVRFRIVDRSSGTSIVQFEMTPADFLSAAMGRLGNVKIDATVGNLERIGLFMVYKSLKFEMPSDTPYELMEEVAKAESDKHCPEGWEVQKYFASQNSFALVGDKRFARTTIRKWVTADSEDLADFRRNNPHYYRDED